MGTVPCRPYLDYDVAYMRLCSDELMPHLTMPRRTHHWWRLPCAVIDMVLHMFIISFIFPQIPSFALLPLLPKVNILAKLSHPVRHQERCKLYRVYNGLRYDLKIHVSIFV